MASSRWKRFAFFERQALNLPGEVLDDLIPPEDGSNAGQAGGGSSRPHRSLRSLLSSSSGGTGGPQQPPPNALTPAGPAVGDLVSLVVTTAALPTSTRSAGGYGKAGMVSDDAAAAALAARRDTAAAVASSSSSSNQSSSLDAMWCTLAACAAPASGVEDPSSRAPPPVIPLPSQAAAAGPATAATLPNDGIQPTDTSGSTTSRGGGAGAAAAAAVIDGLVLAFVSSRETELVHCVDLTVRCNPSRPQPDPFAASSGRAATDALEELDGWRGYFSPFSGGGRASTKGTAGATTTRAAGAGMAASPPPPPPPPGASSAVGARADEGPPKIVGLAVCRTSSRQVHLACLAESDVAVWVDPHLHLSCRRPITPPSRPVEATTHSLPHGLSDGRGCAVDVRPGIVAVGMDVSTNYGSADEGLEWFPAPLVLRAPRLTVLPCHAVRFRWLVIFLSSLPAF
jgi:vacuolar protein sorting-associated protein 11